LMDFFEVACADTLGKDGWVLIDSICDRCGKRETTSRCTHYALTIHYTHHLNTLGMRRLMRLIPGTRSNFRRDELHHLSGQSMVVQESKKRPAKSKELRGPLGARSQEALWDPRGPLPFGLWDLGPRRPSAGVGGPGWCPPGSWPHRDRPIRTALYRLSTCTPKKLVSHNLYKSQGNERATEEPQEQ
jgi:hypothetical protein